MDKLLLKELFTDAGFDPDSGDMEYVYDQILNDLTNRSDIDSDRYSASSSSCSKCENYKYEIKGLETQIECFKNSVRQRRDASNVWIGQDGGVKYE